MNTRSKNILVWVAVVVSLGLLWQMFYEIGNVRTGEKDLDFTSFHNDMVNKKIKAVNIVEEQIRGEYQDGGKFKTVIPEGSSWELVKSFEANGIRVRIEKPVLRSGVWVFVSSWMPLVLLIGFWTILAMKMKGGTK